MKFNKFFMLAMAGLAMTACSSDDEMGTQFPNGNGAVSIRIVNPAMSRAVVDGHDKAVIVTPAVGSDVTVILMDGDTPRELKISAENWEVAQSKVVTFWGVTNPTSVSVAMNNGRAEYTDTDAVNGENVQKVENVPVYGATSDFTLTEQVKNPSDGNMQDGYLEANKDTKYQMYTATVKMAIPVARLEVSGIKHVTHTREGDDNCKYQKLTIAGVYLDNVIANGAGVKYAANGYSEANGTPTDYCFDGTNGTGVAALLKDEIVAPDNDFLAAGAEWPKQTTGEGVKTQVFGYNFFGCKSTNMPKFKIYFSDSKSVDESKPLPAPRYAMITKYKNTEGDVLPAFEPGKIYRITEAVLSDQNIIGDEGGNTTFGVEVTVIEAEWQPVNITAEWQD